ncbi:MAG: NusA-like transcription termination signal-binding factor [Thermoproteota archaeon]|jgi:NusA family KH domain protein, archaeal
MSEGIKLGNRELEFMNLFELISSVKVKDCIVDDDFNRIIFIVNPKEVGLAIGKNGERVQIFKKMTSLDAEVLPYYENAEEMIRGCFFPFEIREIKILTNAKGDKIAYVYTDPAIKARVIGAKGRNIARAKLIARRYFGIKNVIIV